MKKKFKKKLLIKYQQPIAALNMLLIGILLIISTKYYNPKILLTEPTNTKTINTVPAEIITETESEKKKEIPIEQEKSIPVKMPSVVSLNFAYKFPEGADQTQVTNSYAGQAYATLSNKDAEWIAEIYGLVSMTPEVMAIRLGRSRQSVLGLYDMNDETHQPDQADSWLVNSWSKTNVTFYDGDGNVITGYSNAKEILSMASVYAYKKQMEDPGAFQEYIDKLWAASHHYSIRMGDVYYCDGSQEKALSEEVPSTTAIETATTETAVPETSATETSATETSATETTAIETAAIEAEVIETTSALESTITSKAIRVSTDSNASSSYDAGYSAENLPQNWEMIKGPERDIWASVASNVPTTTNTLLPDASNTAEAATPIKEVCCPGHIDLYISAYIDGLKENKGLYYNDPIGNSKKNLDATWLGWDDYHKLYAKCIAHQDWYQTYGLTVSSGMYIRNPLSRSEIAAYMNLLPADTSPERRRVVLQALQSVGCIPYYWGGKPTQAGLNHNSFGAIVSPDEQGRVLRGLDCSGWINWVYWSAFGNRLASESTSGLAHCGVGIQREQLRPGDIIVLTGEDAHVFLFMAWSTNDQMYLIHETGGVINNVTISQYNIHWPYYRNLMND